VTVLDRRGSTADYYFDSRRRLTSYRPTVGGTQQTTDYLYDNQGHRRQVTDPMGNATTWTYDDAGNIRTEVGPAVAGVSPTTSYDYDTGSNHVTKRTDPRGFTTTMAYDAATKNLRTVTRQV